MQNLTSTTTFICMFLILILILVLFCIKQTPSLWILHHAFQRFIHWLLPYLNVEPLTQLNMWYLLQISSFTINILKRSFLKDDTAYKISAFINKCLQGITHIAYLNSVNLFMHNILHTSYLIFIYDFCYYLKVIYFICFINT